MVSHRHIFLQKFLFAFLLFAALPVCWAQEEAAVPEVTELNTERVLGSISFPTMTQLPEAQNAFIEGMLLLHLFEYPDARVAFLKAQDLAPDFAMAVWGEAMTHNHPVWGRQDLEAGRAALRKLGATPEERITHTPAAREQGFLAALELLYGAGTKAQRDLAYMRAMEQLAVRYPDDHEVQLFYVLSLFGVEAGVRNTATYMMCTALAQDVFSENPRHPGAAHYLIHGVDDPIHAVLGLSAARALALMAPDAGHAQHMTSHIFLALGMWGDVVAANEAAIRVQNSLREERGLKARHWGHYNQWLLYGLLQQGRYDAALELLRAAYAELQADGKSPTDRMILSSERSLVGSVVKMWARFVIETRQWDSDVAGWAFNSGDALDPNLNISFVRAMQSAHAGLAAQTDQYINQFSRLRYELAEITARQDYQAPADTLYLQRVEVMELLLRAAKEYARGNMGQAVRIAGEASVLEGKMPVSSGPPYVDLPSAEYLGDLLLGSRKYAEAAEAYSLQLERSRQKPHALRGLAEAQAALGEDSAANYTRGRLERIRSAADEAVDRPR